MRVKIISDSTCDLSPALLERYDIAVTPLCVIKDGKDFHDGVDITPADIFAHVDGGAGGPHRKYLPVFLPCFL